MRARPQGNEKLRTVRIRAFVRHTEQTGDDRERGARAAANRETKMCQFREATSELQGAEGGAAIAG